MKKAALEFADEGMDRDEESSAQPARNQKRKKRLRIPLREDEFQRRIKMSEDFREYARAVSTHLAEELKKATGKYPVIMLDQTLHAPDKNVLRIDIHAKFGLLGRFGHRRKVASVEFTHDATGADHELFRATAIRYTKRALTSNYLQCLSITVREAATCKDTVKHCKEDIVRKVKRHLTNSGLIR